MIGERAGPGLRRMLLGSGLVTIAFGIALTAITGSPLALLAVAFGAADVALGAGLRLGATRGRGARGDDPARTDPAAMDLRGISDASEVQTSNGDPSAHEG